MHSILGREFSNKQWKNRNDQLFSELKYKNWNTKMNDNPPPPPKKKKKKKKKNIRRKENDSVTPKDHKKLLKNEAKKKNSFGKIKKKDKKR